MSEAAGLFDGIFARGAGTRAVSGDASLQALLGAESAFARGTASVGRIPQGHAGTSLEQQVAPGEQVGRHVTADALSDTVIDRALTRHALAAQPVNTAHRRSQP